MKKFLYVLVILSQSAFAHLTVEPFLGYTLNHELKSYSSEVEGLDLGTRVLYSVSSFHFGFDYRLTDYTVDSNNNMRNYSRKRTSVVVGYNIFDWKLWFSYGTNNSIEIPYGVNGSMYMINDIEVKRDQTFGFGYAGFEKVDLNFEYNSIEYLGQTNDSMTLSVSLPVNFFEN